MDQNQQQAQRIQQLGLVAPEHLQRAIQLTHPHKDLCAVLCEQGILPVELAPQIRSESLAPQSSQESLIRSQAAQAIAAIASNDPHFAPHIAHVLERREELGRGGMGVVYRVVDKRLKREAALKILRAELGDADDHLRFQREAEVMAQLVHPAIPPVYEMGITPEGESYMLMKVVEGETLKQRLLNFQFSSHDDPEFVDFLRCLVKVSEAMAFAHSKGFLHRDLKPANIMIGEYGEVQVMDWGLSRKIGQKESNLTKASITLDPGAASTLGLTKEGSVLGTPGYMPPEQISGAEIDERIDIFALGCILTEVLTGRPPVEGRSPIDCLVATMHGEINSPRQRNPAISIELDAIAVRCLEFDRDNRTSSMEELGQELLSFIENKDQAIKLFSKQSLSGLVFGISVVMLGLSTWLYTLSSEARTGERQANNFKEMTRKEAPPSPVPPKETKETKYVEKVSVLLSKLQSPKEFESELDQLEQEDLSPEDLIECAEMCEQLKLKGYHRLFLIRAKRLFPKSNMVRFKVGTFQGQIGQTRNSNEFEKILSSGVEDEYYWATRAIGLVSQFEKTKSALQPADRRRILGFIDKALAMNPEEADFYFVRGRVDLLIQKPGNAIKSFSKAIELRPNNPQIRFFRAKIQLELALIQIYKEKSVDKVTVAKAIADAEATLLLDNEANSARILIGRAQQILGQFDSARVAFLAVLNRKSATAQEREEGLIGLGSLCERKGKYAEAIKHYQRALLVSTDVRIEMALARVQILNKDYRKATESWRRISRSRKGAEVQIYLARGYLGQNFHQQALTELNKIKNHQQIQGPLAYDYHYYRGLALSKKKSQLRDARFMFLDAIRLSPKSIDARIELIDVCIQLEDFEMASAQLSETKVFAPKDIRLVIVNVSLELAQTNYVAAASVCQTALNSNFDREAMILELARVRIAQGRMDLAEVELNKAMQINEGNPKTHFMLGQVLEIKAGPKKAYMAYFRASALNSPDLEILLKLGKLAYNYGDYQSALDHYTQFLKKRRSYTPSAYLARARVFKKLKDYKAALRDINTTINAPMGGRYSLAFLARAEIMTLKNEKKKAIADYERFLDLSKGDDRLKIQKQAARYALASLKKSLK